MPRAKRLRVFAGPNGSGKSTLYKQISSQFNTGYFVNSDEIEQEISKAGFINLSRFGLKLTQEDLDHFFCQDQSITLLQKAEASGHPISIAIRENMIVDKSKDTHSYEASLITSFIRYHLLENGISYSFETVMSHPSKLGEIEEASERKYRTYLYFVCLDDPLINISRVEIRKEKGGHGVPQDKIVDRYYRTLSNLLPAIKACKKAYLFDNSGETMVLIAEVLHGAITILLPENKLPNWFIEYVVNKINE
ncbi:zeta toxin family protein [Sphingobacterium thalpophilum]|uniref:UDP-N-acetylglucosamine kinase n=1 Tax=Sphingobacterium thalpophilum TaxID=259 RepID=A0ABV4HE84_9SPHI|nr:hypothetical protein [Sphingobacterium thalpophilum]